MADRDDLGLFQGYGIEIEYMMVARAGLDVMPLADHLLDDQRHDDGPITWSNELALHVIELKTNGPVASIAAQRQPFTTSLQHLRERLAPIGARLLPGAMHPWMDPHKEFRLWPHGDRAIYAALDRIFDCRGHGWANLQSLHLNLPFAGDDEFKRLHAAIRLLLPILPAIAAASPFVEGRASGWLDTRMRVYRDNCRRIPCITADVVPEAVSSEADYEQRILQPMYTAIAAQDPQGILQYEWLNARGAIARFDRNTIEIRVLDSQECISADLALAELCAAALRALVAERWADHPAQFEWPQAGLLGLLERSMHAGDQAMIDDAAYLRQFGFTRSGHCRTASLWEHLTNQLTAWGELSESAGCWMEHYLRHGCLARRLLHASRADRRRPALTRVYNRLASSLDEDTFFVA